MATPPEEIARQHNDAVRLVQHKLGHWETEDLGEIPLSMKRFPTCERSDQRDVAQRTEYVEEIQEHQVQRVSEFFSVTCVSSRGRVDVSKLQDLLREGYDDPMTSRKSVADRRSLTKGSGNVESMTKGRDSVPGLHSGTVLPKSGVPAANQASGYSKTNLWDAENIRSNNVQMTRPSHDAWGIKKIILMFCSDFLDSGVFEFPWWHDRQDMQEAIRPILNLLQIEPDQIARMLMAALPPGVTIPIHHDTGEWVKQTHRVHVPILVSNPDHILFRCGPTEEQLVRVDCVPGHVFEMNNQAKHTVSNCGKDHRVHLILDYVDTVRAKSVSRVKLEAGERLLQTRRSIDRWKERGARPCPSFLILGAQKAGTTSLYNYVGQHPLVVPAKRRETHCLDWRWDSTPGLTLQQEQRHCNQFYHEKELRYHPSCLTGDSTPSYLLDSRRVIPRLKRVFPHCGASKMMRNCAGVLNDVSCRMCFFVMLRNPVARVLSHYAMVTSVDGTPAQKATRGTEWLDKSLEEVVKMDLRNLQACGVIPYWDIDQGCINDHKLLRRFLGSQAEEDAWNMYLSKHVLLNTGSYGIVARGMYELQLRPWLKSFSAKQFLCLSLEYDLSPSVLRHKTMHRVWKHLGIPSFPINDVSPKNQRSYEMSSESKAELRQYLHRFFEPHNERLFSELGKYYSEWQANGPVVLDLWRK